MKVSFKASAIAVAVSMMAVGAASAQTVKVAFIEGMSGPFGGVGQNQLNHFQYAVEQFSGKNANSGVTVQIVPMDSKGSPQEALALFKKATDFYNTVNFFIRIYLSGFKTQSRVIKINIIYLNNCRICFNYLFKREN